MNNENDQNPALGSFFSGLRDRMDLVAGYEARIARFQAPRFNVFDYIEPNENKVTAILRDFLDPNGPHGQGSVFLESFLQRIGFNKPSKDAITRAVSRTEDRTAWNRRVDLTIRMNQYFLGLENKINADEQSNQVGDYLKFLRSCSKEDWFFVFLTRDGRDPKQCCPEEWQEAREQGKALSLSYAELSFWLRSVLTLSSSDRVRALVQDMANWTETLRGGNMTTDFTSQSILEFIMKNSNYLRILLAIQDSSVAVRKGLVSEFGSSLEREIRSKYPIEDWEIHSKLTGCGLDKEPGITVRKRSWPEGCWIGFAADNMESAFGYGLAWHNADPKIKDVVQKALVDQLGKGRKPTEYWPWMQIFRDLPTGITAILFRRCIVKETNSSATSLLRASTRLRT